MPYIKNMEFLDIRKMLNNIIETFDLSKIYTLKGKNQKILALNNVNLKIKKGEIFGLLGPNGAGKTTIINILTTLIQPTSGYAIVNGYNILKKPIYVKNGIALMLESDMLYYRLTGYDNLKFFCKIYKIQNYQEKIYAKAKDFGLENWLNQYVENYSSGMKMKLALLKTLLLERNLIFLDEPTLGLDVKSIGFIIKKLKELKSTIFLTSHDMSVVEKLCNRIAFINQGSILKVGTKEEITKLMQNEIKIEIGIKENKNQLKSELNQLNFINEIIEINEGYIVSIKNRDYYKNLLKILSNYSIIKVQEIELSIEDLFLKLI